MQKTGFISEFQVFDGNLWGGHIKVADEYASLHIRGENRRIICTLPQDIQIHAALMPSKTGWFVLINKAIQKKLGLRPGMQIKVDIQNDESEYGMPMPDELNWVFGEDPDALNYFEALTPGKKRNLIYLVSSVKNQDSRIKKSLAIADHLKSSGGKLDFKQLNERIKYYNQEGSSRLFD